MKKKMLQKKKITVKKKLRPRSNNNNKLYVFLKNETQHFFRIHPRNSMTLISVKIKFPKNKLPIYVSKLGGIGVFRSNKYVNDYWYVDYLAKKKWRKWATGGFFEIFRDFLQWFIFFKQKRWWNAKTFSLNFFFVDFWGSFLNSMDFTVLWKGRTQIRNRCWEMSLWRSEVKGNQETQKPPSKGYTRGVQANDQ